MSAEPTCSLCYCVIIQCLTAQFKAHVSENLLTAVSTIASGDSDVSDDEASVSLNETRLLRTTISSVRCQYL